MPAAGDTVALGRIGRPHGVRGLVWARAFTACPEDIVAYGALQTGDGRRLEAEVARVKGAEVVLRISGVTDRDQAAALTGQEVHVPRSALPEAAAEEFYHHDLIGLAVVTTSGEALGRVVAVHDFGAGTVLEVEDKGSGGVFVPFNADAVPEVDIEGGRLLVAPLPGLLDGGDPDEPEEEAGTENGDG